MIDRRMILIVVSGMIASLNLSTVQAQRPDPNSPRYKGVVALSDFLGSDGQEALKQFVNEKVSKELLGSLGQDRVSSELNELRSKFAGVRRSGARPEGPFAAQIVFSNGESISFDLEANPPHRFVRIGSIGGGESPGRSAVHAKPQQENGVSSFAQLDEMLDAEADAETFSGVVLVAKDGVPIFHEA
ncbi:MAG: hypothetical protein O7D32_03940, partial [bacterium]|nr:hypothetical protein [bacterium]